MILQICLLAQINYEGVAAILVPILLLIIRKVMLTPFDGHVTWHLIVQSCCSPQLYSTLGSPQYCYEIAPLHVLLTIMFQI